MRQPLAKPPSPQLTPSSPSGYALLRDWFTPEPRATHPSGDSMPSRKTNGAESFGDLVVNEIARLVDELETTESVVRTDHSPEAIHRMRAASRRLRTALLIFQPHLSSKHAEHAKSA